MLRNVDNTCYINSLVHIISWMLERTGSQVTCLGLGQHAWRAILVQRKAVVVHRLIPWSFLMQGWSHGGQQHDICEFFSHLLCRMQTSPFQGTWSARYVEAGRTYIHDYGECSGSHLLTLDVPIDGQWNLQDQVNAWMGQAFTHALKSAPQWLAIRLNRFHRPTASGAICKVRTALSWCTAVQFPVFVDTTLEVYRTTYAVRAFAVHLGASPTSGHYRALCMTTSVGNCTTAMITSNRSYFMIFIRFLRTFMLLFFPGSKTRDLQCILLFMIFRSTSRYAGYAWNSKRVAISRMPSTEWPLMPTVALSVVLSQCVDALESHKAKTLLLMSIRFLIDPLVGGRCGSPVACAGCAFVPLTSGASAPD